MDIKIVLILCIYHSIILVHCFPYKTSVQMRVKREASEVGDLNDDNNYSRTYDSGKGGDIGYLRRKAEKHNRGYELYDSFHKKHADDFEFDNADKKSRDPSGEEEESSGASYSESRAYEEKPKKKAIFTEGYEVTEQHDGDSSGRDGSHSSYQSNLANYNNADTGDNDSHSNSESHSNSDSDSQSNSDEAEEPDYEGDEQTGLYIKSTPIGDYVYHQDDEDDDY